MKAKKIHISFILILFIFIIQTSFISLNSQVTTITETFTNTRAFHPGEGNWVTVTGDNGIVWDMYSINAATYRPPNDGDINYANFSIKGYIMTRIEEAVTQISFKARSFSSSQLSEFQVFLNNQSLGIYSFNGDLGQSVTIDIANPGKHNLLKIQFLRWTGGALYSKGSIDDLSITYDPAISAEADYGWGQVYWIHNGFGEDAKTERYISWATPLDDVSTYVLYGETESLGLIEQDSVNNLVVPDSHTTQIWDDFLAHNVKLSGLNPGTTYYYRCGGDSGVSDIFTFKTAPANDEPFTFAVTADVQRRFSATAVFDNCAEFLVEQDVDYWCQLGDMVQNGGYSGEWLGFFESGRSIFENIPAMVVRGNHDGYEDEEYVKIKSFFPYLNNADRKYAFEYSNSIFVGLDNSRDNECNAWFADQLANTTKKWRFAAWHSNPYSTGGHGGENFEAYLPTVEQYNVTTVFNGHSHAFEFTHPISEVGNPPTLSEVTLINNNTKAIANKSQGTIWYNGAGIGPSSILMTPPQDFTLTGDTAGVYQSVLLATVYNDSIVYRETAYMEFTSGSRTYQKGDVIFTYVVNDPSGITYSLTSTSAGNGSVTPSGTNIYGENTNVVITANPTTGYAFSNWTGDVPVGEENTNPLTITMTADISITANFVALPTYTLTVNGGTGSGTFYETEQTSVSADTPPVGQEFAAWTGDVSVVADVNASTTTVTMPGADVTITATYVDLPTYTLTVTNGTGSGDYLEGASVGISPDAAPAGQEFDVWTGDISYLDNAFLATATVTMPALAISFTATYRDTTTTTYTLTVTNGTGSGDYVESAIVPIVANTPPVGQQFSVWTGDVSNIADVNNASTTITMPTSAVNITATYVNIPTYTLIVINGTGSGDYEEDEIVNIDANTPAAGMEFNEWTGDVTNVADVNNASTTITMPASAVNISATYVSTGTTTYTVTFTVDNGSLPIEYATVTFNSETVLTDANGNVVFSNVLPGTDISYTVAKYGYNNIAGVLTVVDANVSESVSMDLTNVGIEDISKEIIIYPNPATDIIHINNVESVKQVNIYSVSQSLVKTYTLNNHNLIDIDVSNLSKGMYFIQLITDNGSIMQQQVLY